MSNKVDIETATNEINRWLDYKKVDGKTRETNKDGIERLINGVCDGTLVMEDDCTITHTLKFPTDGDGQIKELKYKPRVKVNAIHMHLQGGSSTDFDFRTLATAAAISGQHKNVLKTLDSEDYKITQAITFFFM